MGNCTALTDSTGTTQYAYDTAHRLVSVEGQSYTFDANGHLPSNDTHTYIYDATHRLRSATDGASTSTYLYNGAGDPVAQTIDGTTTEYTLDSAGRLPQVIAAHEGSATSDYVQIQGQVRLDHLSPEEIERRIRHLKNATNVLGAHLFADLGEGDLNTLASMLDELTYHAGEPAAHAVATRRRGCGGSGAGGGLMSGEEFMLLCQP